MHKKNVLIGLILGIIANALGVLAYVLLFSKESLTNTIKLAIENDFLGKLISLGAVLNLVVFFYFIRKREDSKARGVLLATVFAAVALVINKL